MEYDIIGDIHGYADKLEALLAKMGYVETGGRYRHPSRSAIFVGDFIDRGPKQLRTVDIARRMVEGGSALAVMGNHELNAIAWHTPHPDRDGEYLRPRVHPKWGEKNRMQHKEFLAEVGEDSPRHREIVEWFLTLPLWLELDGLRVVHACWHTRNMEYLLPKLRDGRFLTPELLVQATDAPNDDAEKEDASLSVFKAVEAITKGIEVRLPEGHSFLDKDGIERYHVRVDWWDEAANTYRTAARLPKSTRDALPDAPIPAHARITRSTDKPVFFGHYWFGGTPALLAPSATCVDYSAGKGGPLVAYQWRGERELDVRHFVSTP